MTLPKDQCGRRLVVLTFGPMACLGEGCKYWASGTCPDIKKAAVN